MTKILSKLEIKGHFFTLISSVQLPSRVRLPVHHHHHLLEFTRPSSPWCHPAISSSVNTSPPPPIPPSIRVFSNESTLLMRWPKYWSFSFGIIPSKEIPRLISFRMDWLDLLAVQGTLATGGVMDLYKIKQNIECRNIPMHICPTDFGQRGKINSMGEGQPFQ